MKKLHVLYRVSDKGNEKAKIKQATKINCLNNAIREFGKESIIVIADNCNESTIEYLKRTKINFESTSLGNIGSFKYVFNKAIKEFNDDDYVYFLEDDYLHRPGSKRALLEGLEIADYVTLYDHLDQYMLCKNGGSPFNFGKIHAWKIFVTKHSHWREIPSTTMTFATKVKVLKEDYKIWMQQPTKGVPNDFATFVKITKQNKLSDFFGAVHVNKKAGLNILLNNINGRKKRNLISPMPGFSTHTEVQCISPVIDWNNI